MDDRLNFFKPYERSPAWHENQLTRALLVVLRYSAAAHQLWLQLVAPDLKLHALDRAEFATQRAKVLQQVPELADEEAIPGISVWLAPDAKQIPKAVQESDRAQILDGVITYGTDLVVVIENKIGWGGVTQQPSRLNLHGSPIVFRTEPVSVPWQSLLERLADLAERDDLVPLPERMLIGDFFELVEEHFPAIGPYSSLSRCGDHRQRLDRRLDAMLEEIAGTPEGKARNWRNLAGTSKIFMAWLGLDKAGTSVCLRMYPADTLGQARAFYRDAASVRAVLALRSEGWTIKPNFHWGFMATGYAWSRGPLGVDDYCSYWLDRIEATRELPRPEWESYWSDLQRAGVVPAQAREEFDEEFTRSKRNKVHPRPGLACEFRWPLPDARKMDDKGQLAVAIRERLNQMLAALRAPLVGTRPA